MVVGFFAPIMKPYSDETNSASVCLPILASQLPPVKSDADRLTACHAGFAKHASCAWRGARETVPVACTARATRPQGGEPTNMVTVHLSDWK